MKLDEAKKLLEENGYILESNYLDEGIFDSIKNKFFKKKETTPEVKPMKKKLYDDQIAKTSQQAYNHTTESMSTLKQVANNFNGKKAGEFKELWSGLSKLLNKHGMSVKNHNYYLGITNNNAEFSVWAYIANPEKDWTDIKIIGRAKANISEYKYTTNYDLDDSSLKGQAEDLNEWLVELDSIALKLFKGASREEWEEGAHQNESKVNKAIKLLESVGYIVENEDISFEQEAENIVYSYGVDKYGLDVDQIVKIMEDASEIKGQFEQTDFITNQIKKITGLTIWGIEENEKIAAAHFDICNTVYKKTRNK